MQIYKTNWEKEDFVNADDYNRIMEKFSPYSAAACGIFYPVDENYVFLQEDIEKLRASYEATANTFGVLAEFPLEDSDIESFMPDEWNATFLFPRLCWRCTRDNDYNFPPAWELNLYERLCQYVQEREKAWFRSGEVYTGEVLL